METFAYGSTPLRSFLALFACDAVAARLARSDPQRHTPHGLAPLPKFVVLGSSLGWLVFYGACVFGLPSEGVEILPLLCRTATETAAAAGLGDCVRFENADMLTHDLRGADIVMLASQCWERNCAANSQASCSTSRRRDRPRLLRLPRRGGRTDLGRVEELLPRGRRRDGARELGRRAPLLRVRGRGGAVMLDRKEAFRPPRPLRPARLRSRPLSRGGVLAQIELIRLEATNWRSHQRIPFEHDAP